MSGTDREIRDENARLRQLCGTAASELSWCFGYLKGVDREMARQGNVLDSPRRDQRIENMIECLIHAAGGKPIKLLADQERIRSQREDPTPAAGQRTTHLLEGDDDGPTS